ncbi:MAG: hypothetical protein K0R54_552 [Clostridiaceae bacterium]|jgi:hypothetical protein|nr:hypothetical protein [Clostridiaceae bacterium]
MKGGKNLSKGGVVTNMSTYEEMSLIIAIAMLIAVIINGQKK